MTAVTNRQYVQAKMRDAQRAENRVRAQARSVFGGDSDKVVDRALEIAVARLRNDNPDVEETNTPRRAR